MSKLRIGIIGVTGRGSMAEHWHSPEGRSELAGGMDVSQKALAEFREKHGKNLPVTTSVDELLELPDMDAVAVMSPDWTHEEYVIRAFEAGKHVFCEKPMAITTEGCDRMLQAWKDSGKKFMIGFNMRYMNIFRTMKEIADSGTIGEIKVVWCRHFVGHGGRWYFHDWHGSSRNSTGLPLQKASHDIDMIHWITEQYCSSISGFGSLDYYGGDRPDELTCPVCDEKETCPESQIGIKGGGHANQMEMCAFRREIDVEDSSTIMMQLDGGVQATYMQCHYSPDYWRNYTFIGTEGRMENLDDHSKVIVKLRDRSKRTRNLADRVYEVKPARGGHGGADPLICRDFVDMVLDGKTPVATPLAGRMSVAAACAGTESVRNGSKVVPVPPLPEECRAFVTGESR